MGKVADLTEKEFAGAVASGVVLVDFWAPWCGPCRGFLPVLDQTAEALPEVKVYKVNVDECTDLAAEYEVQTVPTVFVWKNGQMVRKMVGVQTKAALVNALQNE
ncbi:MAG: thioredoxin [Lentisphaeria bacterium]|nr:thioredoxin [Lentisphaeria bacterium]